MQEIPYLSKADAEVKFLLVSRMVAMSDLYGHEYGKVICPFHDDTSPSAKLYKDDDKIERLYCYSCNKQYTSWHYLKLILGQDPMGFLRKKFEIGELEEYAKILTLTRNAREVEKGVDVPDFRTMGDLNLFLNIIYVTVE